MSIIIQKMQELKGTDKHKRIELTKSRYVHNENTLQEAINLLDSGKSVTQGVTVNSFK